MGRAGQPTLAALLPGCGFESLLPDAYYVSNREADRRVRPLSLRAAISWLEGAVNLEASQLRAVVAGCGESRIDEYRIGFTARNSNDVLRLRLAAVRARGRPAGRRRPAGRGRRNRRAARIRRQRRAPHSRLLPPDYCEDCGAPYFPNPLGELVHAELPEDAEAAPAKFH